MKIMKNKIVIYIIYSILMLLICSCGNDNQEQNQQSSSNKNNVIIVDVGKFGRNNIKEETERGTNEEMVDYNNIRTNVLGFDQLLITNMLYIDELCSAGKSDEQQAMQTAQIIANMKFDFAKIYDIYKKIYGKQNYFLLYHLASNVMARTQNQEIVERSGFYLMLSTKILRRYDETLYWIDYAHKNFDVSGSDYDFADFVSIQVYENMGNYDKALEILNTRKYSFSRESHKIELLRKNKQPYKAIDVIDNYLSHNSSDDENNHIQALISLRKDIVNSISN